MAQAPRSNIRGFAQWVKIGHAGTYIRTRVKLGRHRIRSNAVVLFLLASAAIVATTQATNADLYQAPSEPLTAAEQLSYSVGSSDEVVLGEIIGVADTMVQTVEHDGYLQDRSIVFRVHEWLKGSGPPGLIRVGVNADGPAASTVINAIKSGAAQAVLFMSDVPPPPTTRGEFPWPHPPGQRWSLKENPFGYQAGMAAFRTGLGDSLLAAVRNCIAIQSPESLACLADAIVDGDILATRTGTCSINGQTRPCYLVHVNEVLFGGVSSNELALYLKYGSIVPGRHLMFLRKRGEGSYTSATLGGSSLQITQDDDVPKLHSTLSDVKIRVNNGLSARKGVRAGQR